MACIYGKPLSDDEINQLMDDESADAGLRHHLATCPDCHLRYDEIKSFFSQMQAELKRKWCPPTTLIYDFVANELKGALRNRIDIHVTSCADCQREVLRLRRVMDDSAEVSSSPRQTPSITRVPPPITRQLPTVALRSSVLRGQGNERFQFMTDGLSIYVELKRKEQGLLVTGQIISTTDDELPEGTMVEVWQQELVQAVGFLDNDDEFYLELLQDAPIDLKITLSAGRHLIIKDIKLSS